MTVYADIAVAVLAAGQSKRFGSDKLMADLDGRPIGLHIVQTLVEMEFGWRFVVCPPHSPLEPYYRASGFAIVINENPEKGQARSLHLAVGAALPTDAKALLVVLADMPFVSSDHIADMIAAYDGDIVASCDGSAPMPPAIFPHDTWPTLLATAGDAGARGLLKGAKLVAASPAELRDIDEPADLRETPSR